MSNKQYKKKYITFNWENDARAEGTEIQSGAFGDYHSAKTHCKKQYPYKCHIYERNTNGKYTRCHRQCLDTYPYR